MTKKVTEEFFSDTNPVVGEGLVGFYEALREAPSSSASSDVHLEREERKAYIDDKKTDTLLKKKYATFFFWLLVVQLIAMNVVLILVGMGNLNFTDVTMNLYMGGTLAEVFGIVFVITRYLFSNKYK